MTSDSGTKSSMENVAEIVRQTKELLDRLKISVAHQSDLTKECTDSSVVVLSENVATVKSVCTEQEKELQDLKKQIEAAELRLNSALEEYKGLKDENATLQQTEDAYIKQMASVEKHQAKTTELRNKLRGCKWITGIRFDSTNGKNIVTGYLAISGNNPCTNALIPFEIEKNNPNNKEIMWKAITETCYEINKLIVND